MGLESSAERWLLQVAVKKIVYGLAKGAAGLLAYTKIQSILNSLGFHNVNAQEFQIGAAGLMFSGLAALHDYAKLKFPNQKWL